MGTNYYHRTEICDKCARYNQRHIGKSSAGWTFSFRGYRPNPNLDEEGPRIESYQDWLEVLRSGGEIWDEYKTHISLLEFMDIVESKRTAPHSHARECPGEHTWFDDEGYSFSDYEFS